MNQPLACLIGADLPLGDVIRALDLLVRAGVASAASPVRCFVPPERAPLCAPWGEAFTVAPVEEAADGLPRQVLYLSLAPLPPGIAGRVLELGALLPAGETLKQRTRSLPQALLAALGLTETVSLPAVPPAAVPPPAFDVALNWRVPADWQLKTLPPAQWAALEQALTQRGLRVTRQPEQDDGLAGYMAWCASARVMVSCVGLGCHLGLLYRRPTVILAGPTLYDEALDDPLCHLLSPQDHCPQRPCNAPRCSWSPNGDLSTDGCMPRHDLSAIIPRILSCLAQEAAP